MTSERGEARDDGSFWASPAPGISSDDRDTATFWACLSKAEQTLLSAVGKHVNYPAGQRLLLQGSAPHHVLIVLDGRAVIRGEPGHYQTKPVSYGPGDLIGAELALTGQVPTATVAAHTMVDALVVACDDFIAFLTRNPAASLALLRLQAQRLQAEQAATRDTLVFDPAAQGSGSRIQNRPTPPTMADGDEKAEPNLELQFRLLGPLSVSHGEHLVHPGPPKQRVLLSILLLADSQVVHTERIIDAMWDGLAPDTAPQMLYSYISKLRQTLHVRPGLEPGLLRASGGYRLVLNSEQVDVHRFRKLVRQGREVRERGDLDTARQLLRAALDQWGTWLEPRPLADVSGNWADSVRMLLVEEYDQAMLDLAHIELATGRHEQILPMLQAFTHARRFNEKAIELLMITLYRAGRKAEALATYQQARTTFDDNLGVDPGRRLSELHQRILVQDPALTSSEMWR
jgi:DNA-binding SARP family transcriptional activator